MGRKALTPEELTTVSDMASRIHEYEIIFSEQAAVLRQDMKGSQEAHARIFSQPPQGPMDSDREDYADWKSAMEAYCQIEPRNLDDRMKIAAAALGLSTSYIRSSSKLPRHVMHAIFVERTRLHDSWQASRRARLQPNNTMYAPLSQPSSIIATHPRMPSAPRLPTLSWDYVDNGSVDLLPVEDCIPDFAKVPSRLLGHVFLYHNWQAADEDGLFKIVDRISSDLRGTSFEVQFVDLTSTIMVPESELLDMVQHSMIYWKSP
ncbi:hypothetical protein F5887DRAFT_356085 [Amanita rubescens]|nr:hypothetical protein F5887DRAFT_356085 [Amanita rubescens]